MRLQLENNIFVAQIDTLGAELCSLLRKDSGEEFVWQGDERYWAGHAPTLFPITGKLKDLRFEYKELRTAASRICQRAGVFCTESYENVCGACFRSRPRDIAAVSFFVPLYMRVHSYCCGPRHYTPSRKYR